MTSNDEAGQDAREALTSFLRAGSGPGLEALEASMEYLADDFTGFGTGPSDH